MAYAFNKVDDYFRKNKMGAQGSLEKGNMGAPAPTAAAENLAASAENSPAQGASETGQFRAAKGANTAAIQSGLTQPAQRQVQNWTTSETAKAGEATKAGESQIGQTYKPFEAGDVAKAEAGQANPLTQQINYTGKELTFNPYQVQMPAIESQQQLAGGVGGMQAALQKQKGGRYTAGMGALDASVLAGSNQGMQGVRNVLGGLRETARGTQQNLEQTDENLATKASTTASGISKAAKEAVTSRSDVLRKALEEKGQAEFNKKIQGTYGSRGAAIGAQQQDYNYGMSSGSQNLGNITFEQMQRALRPSGGDGYGDAVQTIYSPIQEQNLTYSQDFSPEYLNLMNTLGATPTAMPQLQSNRFGYDKQAVMQKGTEKSRAIYDQFLALMKGGTLLETDGSGWKFYKVTTPSGANYMRVEKPDGSVEYR